MHRPIALLLCALAPLALAADRTIPYETMHGVFARVSGIAAGKYFRLETRFTSKDPAVPTADARLVIKARAGDIPVPIAPDGLVSFPVRDDLLAENPPMLTNVGDGKLQLGITMRVEAPPAQRFEYALMAAMQDEYDATIGKQAFTVRMMAPDLEGLLIAYPAGTAATATVEAAKPETFTANAEGYIHIPDRKAWRKQNPLVQLSAMPLRIELDQD
jgi:hypothetical protein